MGYKTDKLLEGILACLLRIEAKLTPKLPPPPPKCHCNPVGYIPPSPPPQLRKEMLNQIEELKKLKRKEVIGPLEPIPGFKPKSVDDE